MRTIGVLGHVGVPKRLYLVAAVAALLGLAIAVLPGLAAGDPANSGAFTAVDYAWNAAGGGHSVTIAQGGTVSFSYPTGSSAHNAHFDSAQPTSCTQTAGPSSGSVPPLPHSGSAPGWSGTCTFNTPGTYAFHCDVHPYTMIGTVVVQASGTTTGTTTAPTTTTTRTTTTSPTPPHSPGSPLSAISIPAVQHGPAVRGSVKISRAGAGGKLAVDVLASAGSLRGKGRGLVRVAHVARSPLSAGINRFSATLAAPARRALRRRHKLTLNVAVTVRSPSGAKATGRRTVVMRR
jgi:plastocyanin